MATAIIVAGLSFGDEGKGTVTDFMTRAHKAHMVVRYNGGAQAAHNVVLDDYRHHTFAQFGSGTFAGAKTFLSRHMMVNPQALVTESKHLAELGVTEPLKMVTIDSCALVTTPFHLAANRLREMYRAEGRHGSCGMGIGETARLAETGDPVLALQMGDLLLPGVRYEKLHQIQVELLRDTEDIRRALPRNSVTERELGILEDDSMARSISAYYQHFISQVAIENGDFLKEALRRGTTIFEGSQGVLLDRVHGFFPYVTRSHTTFKNADDLLDGFKGTRLKVGVLRSYSSRHGAGPFPTEDAELKPSMLEKHNRSDDPWQQNFRVGYFDFVLGRYALDAIGGVDEIAMTHLDRRVPRVCMTYRHEDKKNMAISRVRTLGIETDTRLTEFFDEVTPKYETLESESAFLAKVEEVLETPVTTLSHGPRTCDKKARSTIRNVA